MCLKVVGKSMRPSRLQAFIFCMFFVSFATMLFIISSENNIQSARGFFRCDIEDQQDSPFPKRNIWNATETFLRTPFYSPSFPGMAGCKNCKFQLMTSPFEASNESVDINYGANLKLEDFYSLEKDKMCFIDGTALDESRDSPECFCRNATVNDGSVEYFGPRCDVPRSVWAQNEGSNFSVRSRARRLVMGLVVDHELEMTEVRVRQLDAVVDLFVILESNVTAGGEPKPLYFWDAFRRGFLCDFQPKIVYVLLTSIPDELVKDGWMADDFLRNEMSTSALERISNLEDDDLFLSFDADEIPTPEALLFLKLHDGFHNPIEFSLRWSVFKFNWRHSVNSEAMTRIPVGSTVDFLRQVCADQVMRIRKRYCIQEGHLWNEYQGPKDLHPFTGISVKLQSAIHQDFPRWGDDPQKLDIGYIRNLTLTGEWFDGGRPFTFVHPSEDIFWVPKFISQNYKLYKHLILDEPDTV